MCIATHTDCFKPLLVSLGVIEIYDLKKNEKRGK